MMSRIETEELREKQEISGKGIEVFSFIVPENVPERIDRKVKKFPEVRSRFAAFIGKEFSHNLVHKISDSIKVQEN